MTPKGEGIERESGKAAQPHVPIGDHAMALVAILSRWPCQRDWDLVLDWLSVVGTLVSVELDSEKLNPNFGWCSEADEFDLSREDLLTAFVRDLTLFSFCWSGLEAALHVINLPRHSDPDKRGKIREACYFLREKFSPDSLVAGLDKEVSRFRTAATKCLGAETVERRFQQQTCFGNQAVGLFSVYELRNQFAHGSLGFPMPDYENRPISDHSEMITSASRIVLLQLQMLLLAFTDESSEPVHGAGYLVYGIEGDRGEEDVPLNVALRSCHIQIAGEE